ncbi:MAG: imidazole glycerol phosphate synthase, glutamine amidotransferase subunit [Chloroflexi bacterium RBG_16_64_32]|nr:MAG: imidazole glycerol phosphate synthase, glutamine amidotransferase subunit [Chloroflexi bacterium RBG_16_64_32]
MKLVIVDYGAGNLRSVARAVAHAGGQPLITSSGRDVERADALIVPGVGAAADTMANLKRHNMVAPIREYIASGRAFLGVCMGQQALFDVSEEGGEHPCLGVLAGRVVRLPDGLKVPHMGWNRVRIVQPHPIFENIPDGSYFYFVHSYYPRPDDAAIVIGETEYGVTFASVVGRDNVVATQFHPEKSGATGLRMYENFLRLAAGATIRWRRRRGGDSER